MRPSRQQLFFPRTPEPINHELSSLEPFEGHPLLTFYKGQYLLKVNIITTRYKLITATKGKPLRLKKILKIFLREVSRRLHSLY